LEKYLPFKVAAVEELNEWLVSEAVVVVVVVVMMIIAFSRNGNSG